ncbi:MAG: SCO family protein [Gammaproteobacteria bacterium]|nr:SCO family protein [Gammaproteobacteria bacterium]MDH4315547.1 SCO family protein [Gammaproteobacteria bacterium]MDH5215559.1 SCO family protein [Gammaproteobacteria bacterium]MDH5501495.1 SCO family protein [Gammaproteobacteria bacterium]
MRKTTQVLRYPLLLVLYVSWAALSLASDEYDADVALELSQAAVGRPIGDYEFMNSDHSRVHLHEFAGKPLVVSMIFTSCHHVCPLTTKHLDQAVSAAREALGEDSFEVLTIGFDSANDTPDAMRAFAREQGVDAGNWHFLSGTADVIQNLSADLGFSYYPAPRGFNHINQVTVIDRNSTVYSQVYGVKFELPWLVEPLKELVFNRPSSAGHFVAGLVDRVRLFCTVYDPATGRYEFDRSIFFQIAIGFVVVFSVVIYLWRGFRQNKPGI